MSKNSFKNCFFKPLLLAVTVLFCMVNITSCTRKVMQGPPPVDKPTHRDKPFPVYDQEGFISADNYRVIIVEPRENAHRENRDAIEKSARLRALSSLEKYLISEGYSLAPSTRAKLINLIERYGTIRLVDSPNTQRIVYYYEIRKMNLKQVLHDTCRTR